MSGATSLPNAVLPNKKRPTCIKSRPPHRSRRRGSFLRRASEARNIARCDLARSTGADRMARYKVNPARRAARKVGGASCERHATIDTPRTAGAPLRPRRLDAQHASLPLGQSKRPSFRAACGSLWDRSQSARATTAGQRHRAREDCATERSAAPDACVRVGLQIVSRLDVCTARTPTVCLDSLGLRSPGLAP